MSRTFALARRAAEAASRPKAAIYLKCLDCCGWERREVQRCEIATCPLFALSVRYLGRDVGGATAAGDELVEVADA